MACTAILNFLPAIADSPMDAAIYHPTRNSIFSVRNGYISEYSLALVLLNGPTKFTSSCFGRSCVAYDPGADRIWVGTNGDWAAGYLGDTGGVNPARSTVGLYRIIPSTLAVESFIDVTAIVAVKDWSVVAGVYDVLVSNGKLFGTFGHYTGTNNVNSPNLWSFALNVPAYTLAWSGATSLQSFNTQLAHDSSNQIWVAGDWDNFNSLFPAYGADSGAPASSPGSAPTNGAHCAIAFSTVAGGAIYLVQMPNQTLAKYNFSTGVKISEPAMAGANLGGMTSRIRFNSNDNLLYIPCPATNQVIAFNPSTDTVSKIYTTGMDSPHDMVFAPGGINIAVQQGPKGLIQLTT